MIYVSKVLSKGENTIGQSRLKKNFLTTFFFFVYHLYNRHVNLNYLFLILNLINIKEDFLVREEPSPVDKMRSVDVENRIDLDCCCCWVSSSWWQQWWRFFWLRGVQDINESFHAKTFDTERNEQKVNDIVKLLMCQRSVKRRKYYRAKQA